jgi:hypothetical protein
MNLVPTSIAIFGVKKSYCPLGAVTLFADKGIQMGDMSKLGCLMGLVKHSIWADLTASVV